jgi:UDP-N-acetylglucosamine transferase subunit ALG13
VLLSTGAGPIVPLSLVGKLYGAQTLYIETFGSVDKPSLTGKLMAPLADRLYYQWPQLAPYFPTGRYVGPIFVPQPATRPDDGSLFVAVGTSQRGFDRLMRWIDALARQNALPGPVEAQTGINPNHPISFKCYPQLPDDVLEHKLAAAKVVICHAGAGIVGTCLRLGKRPIVVPRLARYHEAINDHQLMLAEALAQAGQATLVTDEAQLRFAIEAAWSAPPIASSPAQHRLHDAIAADLRQIAARRNLQI